jgi:hypothetical protein
VDKTYGSDFLRVKFDEAGKNLPPIDAPRCCYRVIIFQTAIVKNFASTG